MPISLLSLPLFNNLLAGALVPITGNKDFIVTFGAIFFGFSISAILFGLTIRQGYHYFAHNVAKDLPLNIFIATAVCLLDTLDLGFGVGLAYSYTIQMLGADTGGHVVWNLKAIAVTHAALILLVQTYYLVKIWIFATKTPQLLKKPYVWLAKIYVILVLTAGTAVIIVVLMQIPMVDSVSNFSFKTECILYLALGTAALLDCTTAAAMCFLLRKIEPESTQFIGRGTQQVLHSLVKYFIGTGLMTSFAAITSIVMYVARPDTMLYLSVEFSITRLYANAILANLNIRPWRQQRMNETEEYDLGMFHTASGMRTASILPGRRLGTLVFKSDPGFHPFEFLPDDYQNELEYDGDEEERLDVPPIIW